MPSISVRRLFDDNQYKLQLAWAADNSGADNRIGVEADKPVLALVGHLNFIHPNQIQVVGLAESEYLNRLESGKRVISLATCSIFLCLWLLWQTACRFPRDCATIVIKTIFHC